MKRLLFSALVVALLLPSPALAHGGATDSNGGHMDHSTGEYHYHHGYEAHQHTDGVCPYDFDDQTDHSSGSSSSNSSSSSDSSCEPEWIRYEYSPLFCEFLYNRSTNEWFRDDGEYYESSSELFDCYGFTYSSSCDVWFNKDGFLDEDLCLQDFPDGGFFLCPECDRLMDSDDEDGHAGWCEYLDDEEEEIISHYDSPSSTDIESNPSAPSYQDSLAWKAFKYLVYIGCLLIVGVMCLCAVILMVLYGLAFVAVIFGAIIEGIKWLFRFICRR